jgi:hypothetical protein
VVAVGTVVSVTGKEIGVRTGRGAAIAGRCVGATVRVFVPLLVMLLVLSARAARRTAAIVVTMLRARLAASAP